MNPIEESLTRLMNHLGEKFKNQLVLKGGMLLRLLSSPRSTIDLDYGWVRTKKRNLFAEDLKKAVEEIEGIKVLEISSNSRGVFLDLQDEKSGQILKIEINVIKEFNLPPTPRSTAPLADQYKLEAKIISTMALPESFSNKIAAAIERGQARDFYDLTQLEPISSFDHRTLNARLDHLEIDRKKAVQVTPLKAVGLLKKRMANLSEQAIEAELSGFLNADRLVGLREVMMMTVERICREIEKIGA